MIITNTSTSTVIAIVQGKRLEIKYNQSAIVPDQDGKVLLKLFPCLKEEVVIEAEATPVEPKAEPKVKQNGKGKKSRK